MVPQRPVPSERGSHIGAHLLAAVVVFAVAGVTFWFVAGIAYRIFHLAELFVVAVVCGVTGYRLGSRRRRRR